ncbi:antifreeze protein Maxi-like [Cyclospora cayetanensis]|uniref:Antifreeze protein Maxi-like n=1 Tax=Cyclospora cayetanensis TaxID=88456 RepID=A0A6P6RR58_9EIME|nr:antifreeze protein Maxi-like [Cyclospora cayetanensis]
MHCTCSSIAVAAAAAAAAESAAGQSSASAAAAPQAGATSATRGVAAKPAAEASTREKATKEHVGFDAVTPEEAVAAYLSPSEPASSVRSLCSPDVAAAGSSTVVGSAATSQVQEAALTALLLHLHRGHVSFLEVLKCIERCSSAPGTTATDATAAAEAAAVATPKDCSAYVKAAHTRNAAATLPAQILQRMPELPLKASSSACTATKAATHSAPSSGGMGGSGGGRLAEEDAAAAAAAAAKQQQQQQPERQSTPPAATSSFTASTSVAGTAMQSVRQAAAGSPAGKRCNLSRTIFA